MARKPKKRRPLPLVRLNLLAPILDALDTTEADGDAVLESVGLTRDAIYGEDDFVHVMAIHQFLEAAASGARDPHFLAKVAETIDLSAWPPLVKAAKTARTVGDFITYFANAAEEHATSAEQFLEVRGRTACVGERRLFEPPITPAQNDAFMTSIWITLVRHAMGTKWQPDKVTVKMSNPTSLPTVFHGIRALQGDRMGFQMRFPSSWLTAPFDQTDFWAQAEHHQNAPRPSSSIVQSVRQVLKPHIGDGTRLTTERAAKICRMNQRKLARQLTDDGSSLAAIIDDLYREATAEALSQSNRPLREIASSLGYSDTTALSRSFKRWTGQTPIAFRKQNTLLDDG